IFYLRMGMVPAIKYESDFRADFATRLLDIIERTAEVGKRVNTTDLGRQYMVMSDVGKKRWETAITSGDCFEQFRDFSQLKPFMNEAQWKRLQQILP
ncbi:MAG: hypothetical protein P0S94_01440, partial [Simkaniaceae bacterium]|nr:hypothetical protein [Simkaniaceae bacterium]